MGVVIIHKPVHWFAEQIHSNQSIDLICRANQWTGFYMITTSVMKELRLKILTLFPSLPIWWKARFFQRFAISQKILWRHLWSLNNIFWGTASWCKQTESRLTYNKNNLSEPGGNLFWYKTARTRNIQTFLFFILDRIEIYQKCQWIYRKMGQFKKFYIICLLYVSDKTVVLVSINEIVSQEWIWSKTVS